MDRPVPIRGKVLQPLDGIQTATAGQRPSAAGASPGLVRGAAAACLRASFLACLISRRSRTAFSRLCFAIVVRFLELDAMEAFLSSDSKRPRAPGLRYGATGQTV